MTDDGDDIISNVDASFILFRFYLISNAMKSYCMYVGLIKKLPDYLTKVLL